MILGVSTASAREGDQWWRFPLPGRLIQTRMQSPEVAKYVGVKSMTDPAANAAPICRTTPRSIIRHVPILSGEDFCVLKSLMSRADKGKQMTCHGFRTRQGVETVRLDTEDGAGAGVGATCGTITLLGSATTVMGKALKEGLVSRGTGLKFHRFNAVIAALCNLLLRTT